MSAVGVRTERGAGPPPDSSVCGGEERVNPTSLSNTGAWDQEEGAIPHSKELGAIREVRPCNGLLSDNPVPRFRFHTPSQVCLDSQSTNRAWHCVNTPTPTHAPMRVPLSKKQKRHAVW